MGLSFEEAFQILELPRGSSQDEIRSSYKRLALKWHPDKHGNSSEATKKFQEVSSAYKRLTTDDDDDDIVMTPADMFDLFAHIFFANGMFGCMHHHDSDCDDELTDDDSIEEEFLGGIAGRLRRKYERYEKAAEKKTSAHNLSEAEAMRNAEELIQEEEKERKKAEKRRAKKKRNKERKKQKDKDKEKEKDVQLKKDGKENRQNSGVGQESKNNSNIKNTTDKKNNNLSNNTTNSKKNSSNVNSGLREKTNNEQNPQASKKVSGKNKHRQEEDSDSHAEEPAWDTSSAFFAHAAGQPIPGPPISKSAAASSNTNDITSAPTEKQSDCADSKNGSVPTQGKGEQMDPMVLKSRQIAVRGNEMANAGNYQVAVELFTEAIDLDSRDFRFFGNRSYCFDRMGQYEKALQDANLAITLAPDWPKGYFRRGRALAGLKLFSDAESSFSQVLKLDKHCEDAMFELARVRVQQLEEMGFPFAESEAAIQAYGTVQAALEALLAGKVKITVAEEIYMSDGEADSTAVRNRISENGMQCQALWVGNVDPEHVSERHLIQLFSRCAKVDNVRLLPKRFCAFVNFSTPEGASIALEKLQGFEIGGQKLLLRYPNNTGAPGTENAPLRKPVVPTNLAAPESISQARLCINQASKVTGPVNGDECYFWRTSGCAFGDKCKYAHVPAHKSVDLRKVEAKYGGRLRYQAPNGKS